MPDIELREFSPHTEADLLQQVGRLRVQAWATSASEAAQMDSWLDPYDLSARHWVVLREGVPVASARLTVHSELSEVPDAESYVGVFNEVLEGPIGSLNRLVVHPSARKLGISKQLDLVRLEAAEEMGCRTAVLSTASGPHRVRQLLGFGFEMAGFGPPFQQPPLCYLPPPAVLLCRFPRLFAAQIVEETNKSSLA